ncbi:MAG: hypothetical protein HOE11_02890 [Candidatus Diapherotrites archaeon]|jgi:hypothetical protein|nr:hypothetical protein [Candidatus Diapherotrites archaeon]MBT4596886.1 hypothetical protein [Candidatus Diapherotrites archaeon]
MKKAILILGLILIGLFLFGCTQFELVNTKTDNSSGAEITTENYKSGDCPFILRIAKYDSEQATLESYQGIKTTIQSTHDSLVYVDFDGPQLLQEPLIQAPFEENPLYNYLWVSNSNIIMITQINPNPVGNNSEFATPIDCSYFKYAQIFKEFTKENLAKYPFTSS